MAKVSPDAWGVPLTYSQDEVVVGLVVDGVQHVKHVDGEVGDGAEMRGDGLLHLEVARRESRGRKERTQEEAAEAAPTSEEVVGTSPTAAM